MTSLNQSQKESIVLVTGNPVVSIREQGRGVVGPVSLPQRQTGLSASAGQAHLLGKLCG